MNAGWMRLAAVAVLDRLFPGRGNRYTGDYASWEEARAVCQKGYAAEDILERTRRATREVVEGRAVFERDSVLFHHAEYNWPLLAALWRQRGMVAGEMGVLDFGGALGSAYFQNRKMLEGMEKVRWCVVEQPHVAACGREEFQTERLLFYDSLEACLSVERISVALFASVLGYVPDPWGSLAAVARAGVPMILIDQTLVLEKGDEDRIAVQHVPPSIYKARYPVRLFSERSFERALAPAYRCEACYDGFDAPVVLSAPWQVGRYKGCLWVRNT